MFKFNFTTQIVIGFIVAITLLIVLGYISYTNSNEYQATSEKVAHSNQVLYHAQEVLTITLDIETAQRGFTITADSSFLVPYYAAAKSCQGHVDDLKGLTSASSNQQKRLVTIERLMTERLSLADEIMTRLDRKSDTAGEVIDYTQKGKIITDQMRHVIAGFQAEEKALLKDRLKQQAAVLKTYNKSSAALYVLMSLVLVTLLLLIFKYLHARAKAERLLKDTSEEIKDLYNNAPCGYQSLNANGVIVDINDTLLMWLGYQREEVLRVLKFKDILTEASRQAFNKNFTLLKVQGFLNDQQFDLVTKDGSHLPVMMNSTAIFDAQGNYRKSRASIFNISQIKLMEAQLMEAKQNAESANLTKGQFLANMSHEIRTPLNAIIGLSHLALKTELSAKQFDYLKKIQSSSESLLGIVNDILDFSKIESGKMTLEEVSFDLEEVFQKLADVITYKAQAKGLEIAFGIESNVPTNLIGDPIRLEHILSNLCSNAVKFTDKGEVVIKVRLIEDLGDHLRLQFNVKDTGIGMDREQIGKLFQPFSQADDSISRKYGGTGLGLSIIKRLVELMDGDVSVKSEPGKGSNFNFSIRLQKQKYQRRIPMPSVDPRKLSVLVVDDNKSALKILKEALQSFSFKVITLESGIHAVHFLKNNFHTNPIQLILMDWKMPGMDGLEAASIIRNDPNLSGIRIIMMCNSYGHENLYQKTEELGLSGIVMKPIRYSVLYDSIMSAIEGGTIAREKKADEVQKDKKTEYKGGHLLLVEDNEINQQVAVELLQSIGFSVDIASNGLQAIEQVAHSGNPSKYDLVLMDLQMPVMGGLKATSEIRKLSAYKDLPIIAMTADAMVGVQEKCLAAGMMDFITKPINPDLMLETIEKWIRRENETPGPKTLKAVERPVPILEGISTRDGLMHVAGNTQLYYDLLHKFSLKHEHLVVEIKNQITSGEKEKGMRSLHTLKGMSANLGMIPLNEACLKVETSLKDGHDADNVTTVFQTLEQEMNIVLRSLKVNLGESAEFSHQIDVDKVIPMVYRLEQLIRDSDPESRLLLKEIGKVNGYEKQLKAVEELLDNYDFDNALSLVIAIKSQVK
jgi:PAS domain S-box-containing protein